MLRKNLITKIHIGKSQLGLDDETYRQLLVSTTGKTSCSEMTESELQQVLNVMVQKGFKSSSSFWGNRAAPREDKKIYLNIVEKIFTRYNLKNENKFKVSLYRYFENDFELNPDLKDLLKGKDI